MTDNAVWTEYLINIQYNDYIVAKSQYRIAGDTIFDRHTYKKVIDNKGSCIGAIREENGKIYACLENLDHLLEDEFLLYDFTLQVGDIIKSTASEGALSYPDGLTVIQIDTVTLENGEKRKRFFFNGTDPWIEGIGSTSGLFADATAHPTNYTVVDLVCFKQGNEILYVNEEWCQSNNCCDDLPAGIIDIPSATKTRIAQDNNQVILYFPETFSGETTIRLLDATGRNVFTKMAAQNSFEINTSGYQGIYLISIRNGNDEEYIKLIK